MNEMSEKTTEAPLRHFWWSEAGYDEERRGGQIAVVVFDEEPAEPRLLVEVTGGCHPPVEVLPRLLAALGEKFLDRVNELARESLDRVMVEARGWRLEGRLVGHRTYLVHSLVTTRLMTTKVSASLSISCYGRWNRLYIPLADLPALVAALAAEGELGKEFSGVLREARVPDEAEFTPGASYQLVRSGNVVISAAAGSLAQS